MGVALTLKCSQKDQFDQNSVFQTVFFFCRNYFFMFSQIILAMKTHCN